MNIQKAREYFSAYYEDTLDAGLRQTLEREFAKNPEVAADYKAYCNAVEQINSLRESVIDIPEDLHEQISRRVDHSLWEQKQSKKVGFFQSFWRLGLAGTAAVALIGSFFAIKMRSGGTTSQSGIVSVQPSAPSLELVMKDGEPKIHATPRVSEEFIARDAETGQEISRIQLDKAPLDSPLANENAQSRVIEFFFTKESSKKYVAIPGKERSTILEGHGTTMELAKTIADTYGIPVEMVQLPRADRSFSWKLSGTTLAEFKLATDPASVVTYDVTSSGSVFLSER